KERIESLGICVEDLGDIEVPSINNATNQSKQQNLNNLPEVVLSNKRLAKTVDEIVKKERFPLILGGDHSIAIGSLAGLYPHYNHLGVSWYHAPGDINTPEPSPSGNIQGMPLAVSIGLGDDSLTNIHHAAPKIKPENHVLLGIRHLLERQK